MTWVIIGLVVLAVVAALALFRQRDNKLATGSLAGDLTPTEADRARVIKDRSELEGSSFESAALEARATELAPPKPTGAAVYIPPDEQALGESRRQFLNRGIIASFSFGVGVLGIGAIQTLWPSGGGGFGSKIVVGKVDNIVQSIRDAGGFFYVPQGRMWITEYPSNALVKAESDYSFYSQVNQGLEAGVVALFQTCPHLGCRVPECSTSQWFECPCHGSQYNRVGEKKGGPAPRGMDRFPMEVSSDGVLSVDTGTIIQGPAIGVNTTGQEAEGPNCQSAEGEHG